MQSREDRRLRHIDSLRAIAAVLVLWVHVAEKFKNLASADSGWVFSMMLPINAGRIGVVTFFAISGFLIPFSIKLAHRHPVREFLVTRFFRLYPAYWLSIPLGIVTTFWLFGGTFSLGAALVNLTMLEYIFDVQPALGLYWTLAIELVFYVCCILLVMTGNITRYRRIGLLAALLVALHVAIMLLTVKTYGGRWLEMSFWPMNLGIMFWGTLYRAEMLGLATSRFERATLWATAFFIVVVYPVVFKQFGIAYIHTVGFSIGVLLFIVGTRIVRLEFPLLPWLGLISYSIYLFHPVVLSPWVRALQMAPENSSFAQWFGQWHLGLYVVAMLLLTIAFAALIYYCVERPSIRLGRRLAKRWFDDAESSPAQAVATMA